MNGRRTSHMWHNSRGIWRTYGQLLETTTGKSAPQTSVQACSRCYARRYFLYKAAKQPHLEEQQLPKSEKRTTATATTQVASPSIAAAQQPYNCRCKTAAQVQHSHHNYIRTQQNRASCTLAAPLALSRPASPAPHLPSCPHAAAAQLPKPGRLATNPERAAP